MPVLMCGLHPRNGNHLSRSFADVQAKMHVEA